MQTFKDNMNQEWGLTLTLGAVRSIRDRIGLDLLNAQDQIRALGSLTDRLTIVFLLCETQAKDYEVSTDDFEERLMGGDYVQQASEALLTELANFYQRLGQTAQEKLTRRNLAAITKAQGELARMISSGDFDTILDQAEQELTTTATVGPGSSS